MKLKEILSPSFRDLSQNPHLCHPTLTVRCCRADDSDFCQEAVVNGWLTESQMLHASERYHLGRSRSGKTIFWMIDSHGRTLDGHIGDSLVTEMLRARCPEDAPHSITRHCLFGEHLLTDCNYKSRTDYTDQHRLVCVVESERSAVLLSELFPECLWLAWAYPANMTVDKFEPLKGHRVTLYPRTDPVGENYLYCLGLADHARSLYPIDISVSDVLETNATEEQKERCIDLMDYILSSST